MTSRLLLVCFWLLACSADGLAKTSQTDRTIYGKGVVISSEPSLIYVNGHEQRIVNVQTETESVRVFAPSMGTAAVSGGEKISFAGHIEKIDGIDVINTMTGYIYRQTAKSVQEQMMEQMQQQQIEKNPDIMPNAVPIHTKVTIIGITFSSLFAAIGLLLNFCAIRRSNRIAVATKLAELSKLLSDELVAREEMYVMLERELREAQRYPDPEIATPKIEGLRKSMEINLKRQAELDVETKYLEEAFLHLDKVDIGGVDAQIARSYKFHKIAESGLGRAEKLKRANIA